MTQVLVDSSVWIDFFRGVPAAVRRVDGLLADDRAATTAIIVAEVTSGARTRLVFDELRRRFQALPAAPVPNDLWDRVADTRFTLARHGVQGHLIDVAIASIAAASQQPLLTRDRDFAAIAKVMPLEIEIF